MTEEQFAVLKPTDPEEPSMQDLRSLQCHVLIVGNNLQYWELRKPKAVSICTSAWTCLQVYSN